MKQRCYISISKHAHRCLHHYTLGQLKMLADLQGQSTLHLKSWNHRRWVTFWSPPQSKKGTLGTPDEASKGLPGHGYYLLTEQQLWVQEDLQIAHHPWMGEVQLHSRSTLEYPQIWVNTHSYSVSVKLNLRKFLPIQTCTVSMHWDRTSIASLGWYEVERAY